MMIFVLLVLLSAKCKCTWCSPTSIWPESTFHSLAAAVVHEQLRPATPSNRLLGDSEFCCWELLKCCQMLLSAAVGVSNTSAIADGRWAWHHKKFNQWTGCCSLFPRSSIFWTIAVLLECCWDLTAADRWDFVQLCYLMALNLID